jgi:hypothetical protein
MTVQLDLFNPKSEMDLIREELKQVRERSDNVRRGLFARHNELAKIYMRIEEDHEKMKNLFYAKFPSDIEKIDFKLESAG